MIIITEFTHADERKSTEAQSHQCTTTVGDDAANCAISWLSHGIVINR